MHTEPEVSPANHTRDLIERVGLSTMAKAMQVSSPAVAKWRTTGVPLDRCPQVESAFPALTRCEALRPDVQWHRDAAGKVTGYTVPVPAANQEAA